MVSVFVTGASGFIAQHMVKLLISKDYKVVGTVRSSDKGEKLKENLGDKGANFQYEIVNDIVQEGAFDEALQKHPEVTVAFHTASPFFYGAEDPERDLMVPALNGTKNALLAFKKYGPQIKQVVVTSSDAAFYSADDEQNGDLLFDETSWNNIAWQAATKDSISAYYAGKSYAEREAWKIAAELDTNFTLTAINPVYVFGPQAFINEVKPVLNTSNEVINNLLKIGPHGKFDNDKGGYVDVRDVAKAHVAAIELPEAVGKRLSMTNGKFSTQMMVDILISHFTELRGKIPVGTPGSGPQDISTLAKVDNQKTRDILKFKFHTLEQVVVDTVQQIFDAKPKL